MNFQRETPNLKMWEKVELQVWILAEKKQPPDFEKSLRQYELRNFLFFNASRRPPKLTVCKKIAIDLSGIFVTIDMISKITSDLTGIISNSN